jgi:hypothetical protein
MERVALCRLGNDLPTVDDQIHSCWICSSRGGRIGGTITGDGTPLALQASEHREVGARGIRQQEGSVSSGEGANTSARDLRS